MTFRIQILTGTTWEDGVTDGEVEPFDSVQDASTAARWYLDAGTAYRVVDDAGVVRHRATTIAGGLEVVVRGGA